MKIAIPVAEGKLCAHFGHCEQFALIDVDESRNEILKEGYIDAPPHQPGLLPRWLAGEGANCIIAGGMGSRAKSLFDEANITVITGALGNSPRRIVEDFLNNRLVTGENACDH